MSDHIYTATTPADGRVEWLDIPIGEYEVELTHPDYVDISTVETLDTSGRAPIYEMTPTESTPPDDPDDPDDPNTDDASMRRYTGIQPRHADRVTQNDADVVVSTAAGLEQEIDDAPTGSSADDYIIYIEDSAEINGDSLFRIRIPDGVTVASDGALLYLTENNSGMFWIESDNARVTGIRFRGFHYDDMADSPYNLPSGTSPWGTAADYAIKLRGDSLVDNCRFEGFCFCGITVGENEHDETEWDPHPTVRNCEFERNLLTIGSAGGGLGYGIVGYSGSPLIQYCYFNNNRHSTAGGGRNRSRWTVEDCFYDTEGLQYGAEMHEVDGNAGRWVRYRNNESAYITNNSGDPRAALQLRGTPTHGSLCENNWFYNPNTPDPDDSSSPIQQYGTDGTNFNNLTISNNHYGETAPPEGVGIRPDNKDYVDLILSLSVTDADNQPIESITAEYDGNVSVGTNGNVDVYLPTGTHTITISADGYRTQSITVDMTDRDKQDSVTLEEAPEQGVLQDPVGPPTSEPHFEATITDVQKNDATYTFTIVLSNDGGTDGTTTVELQTD